MLSSIAGHDARWAELAATQASPAVPVTQADWWGSSASSSGTAGTDAVTGVTASPMSSGMNAALLAFVSRRDGTGSPSQVGQDTGGAPRLSTSEQLLNDLHSALTTGGAAPSPASSDTEPTASAREIPPPAARSPTSPSPAGELAQDTSGSATPSADGLKAFMQQFVLAAYSSGYASDSERATSSTSISA